ncbi:DUF418 domain-containing protein [uncultured Sphingomonas sp.]|uniref:DUF418 domain-containing protein n=1 Tax=uncultured Sphingomonas sp. TaxID=158754 RepID=UPI0035CA0AAD
MTQGGVGTGRIGMLDVIRGVAVMGILVANLPAFGLPDAAYFSPVAWGGTGPADRAVWAINFVLVEGKMRGLFSFLFGASMLLVIDRAGVAGEDPARVHFARMGWLFAIGMVHAYLIWWGDILAHYALVGAVAFLFVGLPVRSLLLVGLMLVGVQLIIGAMIGLAVFLPGGSGLVAVFGMPPRAELTAELTALRGTLAQGIAYRAATNTNPLQLLMATGAETLGYMLWGMAGLRSGLLTGAWERARYRRWATTALAIGLPFYAVLAAMILARGFDWRFVALGSLVLATPVRAVLVVGYACLVILAARPGGWLTDRIAAAGRVAFTNYLGTSIVMTAIFHGWGLGRFGRIGRAEMYWLVPLAWGLMLWWSKPWLDRYRYGPLEWLWRSLARLERQPLRRQR